jgi:hypothetical protein
MQPKSSTRDTRLSIKNEGLVTKDEGEVGDGLSSPGAPNDKPSSAVEVNYPMEAKEATNNKDKKMPAIEKDTASQGAKAKEISQEDDGEVIWLYLPYRLLGNGVLTYGRTGNCLPLLCPDVDVRTVTLHIRDSKLSANPRVTLSNCDDAPKYRRTFQMSKIPRAGRAYGNPKIRSTKIFKICKQDSTRYLRNSTSKLIN